MTLRLLALFALCLALALLVASEPSGGHGRWAAETAVSGAIATMPGNMQMLRGMKGE